MLTISASSTFEAKKREKKNCFPFTVTLLRRQTRKGGGKWNVPSVWLTACHKVKTFHSGDQMWWQEAVVSNWGHSATLRLTPFTPSFFSFFFTSFPGYKLHNTTVDKHHFSSPFSLARDTNTPARREVPRVSPTPESPCSGTENQRETFSFPFHLPALKRCNPVRVTRPCRISTPPTFLFFSPVNWERHHVQKRERDCVARVICTGT